MNGLKQPIISAVTGHTEQLYTDKAINSGMNQVFSKPVQIPVLKDLMKKLEFYDPLTDVKMSKMKTNLKLIILRYC